MASYKRRQSSDYNQSVPETQNVPEQHAYQEKHFQPVLNQPVPETRMETEYGSTVTPDTIETRAEKTPHSTYTEQSDQPGEDDYAKMQIRQNLQNNSDPGTQYSTPDVSSGVSSGPGGFTGIETTTTAAATTTAATTTVVASTAATTITTVATATVGATIIAVAFILPLVVGVPSAIIFDDISVTDTTIYYSIYFEDYEEGMDLTVSLHNNFTDRSHKVESHSISVLEENLKPGMTYRLTVYGSMGAILDERTVKTDKSPSGPTFNVETAEFSMSDGLIHLTATLDDPKEQYTDFSMVFYDVKDGNRTEVSRVPISDFSNEITMETGLAADTYVAGVFAVECMDGTESKTLFEKEMTAYSSPYIGFKTLPRIVDGTMTVECIIVDPKSSRSNYHAVVYVENAENSRDSFTDDGGLSGGIFTTTIQMQDYRFHTGFVKVTWDDEYQSEPLVYEYNTLTVGAATMKNDPITYQGKNYEVQFGVEMTLNDDFNYLTDTSGNWLPSMYPTLTPLQLDPDTFYELRRTGDNTYLAVFLTDNWNEAQMYRLDNTIDIGGYSKAVPMLTSEGYQVSTFRAENGDITATMTFRSGGSVEILSARAVSTDGTAVPVSITKQQTSSNYDVVLTLTEADPFATYSIYFNDASGAAVYRQDDVTFKYPRLISATYLETQDGGLMATAVFEYPVTPVYMPDYSQTAQVTTDNDGILTMVFPVSDQRILTGEQYFRFAVQDTTSSDYYWYAVFTPAT